MPGGIRDHSNPNAPKTIVSQDIQSFSAFYIYGAEDDAMVRYALNAEKQDDGHVGVTMKGDSGEEVQAQVGPEFLQDLQKILGRHNLASLNGTYRITSGLPYPYEPSSLSATYVSGEVLSFTVDGNPESPWMGDITYHFLAAFPDKRQDKGSFLAEDMTRFSYTHTGMALPHIYAYEIEKEGDVYRLRADFFDAENAFEQVNLVWEGEEYRAVIEEVYQKTRVLYQAHDLQSWEGFSQSYPGVSDGSGFSLFVDFQDGRTFMASGDNAFPPTYFEAEADLKAIMEEIIRVYRADTQA